MRAWDEWRLMCEAAERLPGMFKGARAAVLCEDPGIKEFMKEEVPELYAEAGLEER